MKFEMIKSQPAEERAPENMGFQWEDTPKPIPSFGELLMTEKMSIRRVVEKWPPAKFGFTWSSYCRHCDYRNLVALLLTAVQAGA